MVTGVYELNVKELEEKLGIMANSGQCCASGTCDKDEPIPGGKTPMPIITKSIDFRNPFAIRKQYGALV